MEEIRNDFAVRAFLLGALRALKADDPDLPKHLPTYGDLARYFGGSNQGQQAVLNRLAKQCGERAEPDLTVLVVNVKGHPSLFQGQLWTAEQQPAWHKELWEVQGHDWSNKDL